MRKKEITLLLKARNCALVSFWLHLTRKICGVVGFFGQYWMVVTVSVHQICAARSILSTSLARNRPLTRHLDAIRKEFHCTVTGNVHISVLASGPV